MSPGFVISFSEISASIHILIHNDAKQKCNCAPIALKSIVTLNLKTLKNDHSWLWR